MDLVFTALCHNDELPAYSILSNSLIYSARYLVLSSERALRMRIMLNNRHFWPKPQFHQTPKKLVHNTYHLKRMNTYSYSCGEGRCQSVQ